MGNEDIYVLVYEYVTLAWTYLVLQSVIFKALFQVTVILATVLGIGTGFLSDSATRKGAPCGPAH